MKLTDKGLQIFGNKTRFSKKQIVSFKQFYQPFKRQFLLKGARDCDLQWSKYRPETTRTEIYAGFGWVSQNLGTGRMAQKQPAKNNKQKHPNATMLHFAFRRHC